VRGDYNNDDDPGEVSHFTALTAALSGTVGLGNIAGVAVAVTVVICTMTALILIVSGVLATDAEGVALTSAAYETVLPWFDIVLAVAVIMFAFSTMLAWSYYGSKAVGYLFGDSTAAELVFKAIFCLFIVIGATMELDAIIGFSDAMIFSMALFNIAGLYLLAPVVRRELRSYERRLGTGEIETAKQREDGATVAPADPPAVTRR
jgi:AGCS family alanine or glycine:cation symporter